MKHWKKQGKRGLSLFLSVVMCLSMVNLTAFAEETSGKIVSQKEDWTMTDDGSVGHKKTIRKTGENTFEITLSVKTKEEIAQQVTSPDAAVVVVMDVSNSMKETVDGGEAKNEADKRITKAKTAAEKFIEDFAADAGNAQRKVALVEFGSNAMTVQGWTDAATAKKAVSNIGINFETPECTIQGQHTHEENTIEWGGFLGLMWRCTEKSCQYSKPSIGNWYSLFNRNYEGHTHEKTYDGPHGDVTKDGGGTNIEGGLQLADNLLNTCPVTNGKKYVVLITDGVPTYHVYRDHYTGSTNFIEGQKGGGNEAKPSDYVNVPDVASNIKSKGALYTVSYASSTVKETVGGKSIDAWLSSFATMNVSAGGNIDWGLGSVSETIKNQAKAWILTDPIPAPYIVYNPEDNSNIPNADVNPDSVLNYKTDGTGTTLTWDLKRVPVKDTEQDGNAKWYLYETSYTVRLDTAAKDFAEDLPYATNGETTLTYMLTKDGVLQSDLKSTDLVVPKVSGTLPMVEWRIEYYKQENATAGDYKNYTLADTTNGGPDKLWTSIVLADKDPEWETKYDNYTCMSRNEIITIQADSENVIKVYYDRKTTSATVNYYYELTIIDENGEKTTTYDVDGTPETGLFVGEEYSADAPETSTYGGYTYNFDHATPNGGKISKLDQDGDKNVIDLYYVKEIDYRRDASVVVNHVYTLHTYELEDGKYVAKDVVVEVPNVVSESGHRAGETYTASYYPTPDFSSYGYMGLVGVDNVKVLSSGPNVITLEFEDWEDPRGPELSLTVKHYYTKSVTKIVDGNVVTTVKPDDEVGRTDTIKFYAGESVTIDEQNSYGDPADTYVSASENASKLEIKNATASDDGKVIDLHYSLVEAPEKTTVTVEHIYKTTTYETVTKYRDVEVEVPAVDADGNPVYQEEIDPDTGNTIQVPVMTTETRQVEDGTEQKVTTVEDHRFSDEAVTVYVDQKYTAEGKPNGYTPTVQPNVGYTADKANVYEVIASADGSNTISLVYTRDLTVDEREDTSIGVIHEYTYRVKTVIGGKVQTLENVFRSDRTEYTGKPGDSFTAVPQPVVGDKTYPQTTPEADLSVVLKASNGDIVIKYTLEEELLTETSYKVNYEYYTRSMTVENGVAVWGEPVKDETVLKEAVNETGYAGQKVELQTGAVAGYNAMEGNPSSIQFLKADGNEWTFRHVKDVPLAQVPVTVNHHVTTKTLTIDSESSLTQDLMGRPEYKYVGESYEAKALDIGTLILVNVNGGDVETQKVVKFDALTGTVVVDFYYEIVNDLRRPVDYSIQYYYYDVNYDGTETLTGEPPATTGSSFAGKPLATTPEEEDVKGYRLTEATFNEVDIMGQQSVTLVDGTNKIVYVYKRSVDTRDPVHATVFHEYYSSASATEPAYRDSVVTYDLRPGDSFTATAVPTKNGVAYTQTTPDSELTKELIADSGSNIIIIRYVLAETTYKVVHTYYTNGSLTGSTDPVTVGGNVGDVVTADSVAKVLTYGGNSYSYTSSSGEFTLVQGENGTITLRYDRTTGGGGDNGGGNNNNNDDDDDDNGSGTPTPPVVDVPDEQPPLIEEPVIDIPDEQPPKEEAPEEEILEEEILEEEVPLSDVPQTGDNSKPVFWAVLGALSFLGIVLLGRKRKDEEA